MKLETARRHALALPGTSEAPHHDYGSWRVHGRIYATLPPGGTHLHVFVPDEAREQALALHPEFVEKLMWGGKVVGLRITLAGADARAVKRLLAAAHAAKAALKPVRPRR
jgi:hypothetical protein